MSDAASVRIAGTAWLPSDPTVAEALAGAADAALADAGIDPIDVAAGADTEAVAVLFAGVDVDAARRFARARGFAGPADAVPTGVESAVSLLCCARTLLSGNTIDAVLVGEIGPGEAAAAVLTRATGDAGDPVDLRYARLDAVTTATGADAIGATARTALRQAGIRPVEVGWLGVAGTVDTASVIAEAAAAYRDDGDHPLSTVVGAPGTTVLGGLVAAARCAYDALLPATPPDVVIESGMPSTVCRTENEQPWIWRGPTGRRHAAIVSFDGRAAVHLVLSTTATKGRDVPIDWLAGGGPLLLVLSADSGPELAQAARDCLAELAGDTTALELCRRRATETLERRYTAVLVAPDGSRLRTELQAAIRDLPDVIARHGEWTTPSGSFCTATPLGPRGRVALVYPGTFASYPGAGADLMRLFPVLSAHLDDSGQEAMLRRDLLYPRSIHGLDRQALARHEAAMHNEIAGLLSTGITFGILHTALLRDLLGVRVDGGFGYSLGECSMLMSLGVWNHNAVVDLVGPAPGLFTERLGGRKEAVRQAWSIPADTPDDDVWAVMVLLGDADEIRTAVTEFDRVYITHVNSPREVVIAGCPAQCRALADRTGCATVAAPSTFVAHCPPSEVEAQALARVADHPIIATDRLGELLTTYDYDRVDTGDRRRLSEHVAHVVCHTVDFPRLARVAHERGFRYFIDIGPGASCTRWIDDSLADARHLAVAVDRRGMPFGSALARALARLIGHGLTVDLTPLLTEPQPVIPANARVRVRLRRSPPMLDDHDDDALTFDGQPIGEFLPGTVALAPVPTHGDAQPRRAHGSAAAVAAIAPSTAAGHRAFLAAHSAMQGRLLDRLVRPADPVSTLAHGVQSPDSPLYQFVSRVIELRGEPGGFDPGASITAEYDIPEHAWYTLDGVVPAGMVVETTQCVGILLAHLGFAPNTAGGQAYRLLSADPAFHDRLPREGQTIRFRAETTRFDTRDDGVLVYFTFRCHVGDTLVMEMADACAGFGTPTRLLSEFESARGARGEHQRVATAGAPFKPLERTDRVSLLTEDVDLLTKGELAEVFGPNWDQRADGCNPSIRLAPGGTRMLDDVTTIDRLGGFRGLGELTARRTIDPNGWYFHASVPDDATVPATLVAEGATQLLQVYAMYLGLHLVFPDAEFQPALDLAATMRAFGQVTPNTRTISYRAEATDIALLPRPTVVADVTVYADFEPIMRITDLAVQIREKPGTPSGATPDGRVQFLGRRNHEGEVSIGTEYHLAHSARGEASTALGHDFARFNERIMPRLPNGIFQFVDRIQHLPATRGQFDRGIELITEYDAAPEEWYFRDNCSAGMPHCVLMETSLQSAILLGVQLGGPLCLENEPDVYVRNLDGVATLLRPIDLRGTTIRQESVLQMHQSVPGAVLEKFSYRLLADGEVFYEGESLFGFFGRDALSKQVGLDAGKYRPSWLEDHPNPPRTRTVAVRSDDRWFRPQHGTGLRLGDRHLRMIENATVVRDGGPFGRGYVHGTRLIDPDDWYFACHFHRDPVMPGSLGVEALIQALQLYVIDSGLAADMGPVTFELAVGVPMSWRYRGQIEKGDGEMTFDVSVKDVRREPGRLLVIADANVWKPGMRIYQLTDIAVEVRPTAR
ncbi:hypothetical protein IU500_03935 [Nocardia terpenica]|uniref:hypothetical protein n=1 Tax=Nocardia terpenica TaxID=455432 RepID=UPI0018960E90|nr:hypothetical protein [Nocardia terpenica]MBF6059267.1 hypothetical protein [Nocardia terpenica]MBF6103194.1 hypothetical protein [Nocardia terpenica]MBF6110617.1 hypothetical protein [Nocardia terpenica]MBF6116748.1 hypothetical protein [Nocardia terpenica]